MVGRWALVALGLLSLESHGLNLKAPAPAPASAPGGAPGAPGAPEIQYSKEFEDDWHKEWKHGDFPSWKKVITVDGIDKFEDRQSDGKPGFLQNSAAPAAAAKGSPAASPAPGPAEPELQFSKEFEEDWHNEWKHGDFPSWKKVIQVDGIEKWEDRQSDGKPGFLEVAAAPVPAPAGAPGPGAAPEIQYSKKFEDDWHKEWKHGDYPSWKKVIDVDGIEKFEDRQSDGKPSL